MKGKIQVSKNNAKMVQQKMADQKQRFGIRKLSVGAASVLLGTVFYLQSGTVYADVNPTASVGNDSINVVNKNSSTSSSAVGSSTSNSAGSSSLVSSAGDAINSMDTSHVSASPVESATSQANKNAVATGNEQGSSVPVSNVNAGADKTAKNENSNVDSHQAYVPNSHVALEKPVAGSGRVDSRGEAPFQPVLAMKAETETPVAKPAVDSEAPKRETVDSKWIIHYVNQTDHKQELKDPTVITMQYTRTNTPQSDGKIQYGDWSYVPDSFKQTGTPITVKDSNNPVKQDNVDKNGENFDVFTITAMYPTVAGYGFYNGINGTRLRDNLRNNERQADAMSKDFYAEYDVAKPTRETVVNQWKIHYVNSADHNKELKAPTVITMQYTRTNTLQSDGTIQHGDWAYVPGSFRQTGTPVTVDGSNNPVKEDNVDNNGKNEDVFTITAWYPAIAGYTTHGNITHVNLHTHLLNYDSNGSIQAPTITDEFNVEYATVSGERSVAVKFVDDQSYDFNTSDHKKQVGQAITLTGHDGDTVNLNLTVPDKYQLADGQQLPTTYTFTKGSGDLTIHLVHKVVQREATVNVKLAMLTGVDIQGVDWMRWTTIQERWGQLGEKFGTNNEESFFEVLPSVEVGTLTGHVNYDVVDNSVVSLGDNWTTLNLGGRTYQLPNGTDVVNGVLFDSDDGSLGKPLREYYLKHYSIVNPGHSVDPDYATRPWYGYLSVNETNDSNNPLAQEYSTGFQGGLAGNEPNALAKANGDQAATAVETTNKTIDVSALTTERFSEQDGQLQATLPVLVYGVYIPYVEKTATRTINVTMPDGKTTTVEQTATLAKQVDLGKDAHPAWTTGEWSSYEVPIIPGYTASQSNVAKETVTGTTEDQTVNITYTANPQTSTVVYQSEDGTPVHTTTIKGQIGQTVKVSSEVPMGWRIVNGKVPSEITFGPDGAPKTVVTIDHSHVTVTPDAPKTTGDKLPDNPSKAYPAGVGETDLNKTITRTIKVTTPDGQTKTIAQTAKLTRTADVDEVTGKVTYSDWTTGQWASYDVPSIPGYIASQSSVAKEAVTSDTKDQTINITYTANEHQISIEYVDNASGQVVKTDHLSGKTGQTVSITPHIPDGWELVSGQSVPSEVTVGADGAPTTVIKVQPQERSVAVRFVDDQSFDFDPGSIDGKTQVGQAVTVTGRDGDTVDLKLTVPDKYQLAGRQQLPTSYTFEKGSGDLTIHLVHKVVQREATVDVQMGLVDAVRIDDGDLPFTVTQKQWTQLDDKIKDDGQPNDRMYPWVKVGTLTGHVGYDLVDNKVVSFADDLTTLNLGGQTYQMPDGTEAVNGIFVDYYPATLGKSIKEELLKHYPDADPDYANRPWHGYLSVNATNKLVSDLGGESLQSGLVGNEPNTLAKAIGDQAATAVKTANKTINLRLLQDDMLQDATLQNDTYYITTRDFSEQNGRLQGIAELQVAGVYIPYVEKTVTRTINVTTPDGKTTAVKQTATLAKQIDFGKDAHPDWTISEWTSYDVPVIPGYTASQLNVVKEAVTGTTNDQTVNITYTANPQTTTVVYQAEDGTPIHTTTINGQTGQTVKVPNEVPAGWMITKGQVPSEITFGPDGTPQTVVTIAHQHVTVNPDAPKTTADYLPDNPGKSYPAGVDHNDLNKTVTGTIKVTMPDGQVQTVLKTTKLTRTADVDEVTGEVKYSDWTTGYWSDYTAPVVPGYTADVPHIAGQLVTGTTTDQTVNITYTANAQTTHVNYVDAQGTLIHATTVNGQTNQTVDVPSEVPTGWKLVDGQTVPSTITFGPDGHEDMSVKIEHRHVTVTPDKPQANGTELPDNPMQSFHGVEASDLNKTVTRMIKVTTPTGKTNTIQQEVKLTRTATVDEVTGDVSYGDWSTGQWDAYQVPSLNGYTAIQPEVAATSVNENTTNQTVDVSYTPNKQSTVVKYVDDDNQVVHTTTVNGVTDQTVKVPNEVLAGWMITNGNVPSEITFGADGHEAIEVTIDHRHVTVDPDQPQTNGTKLPDNPAKTFEGAEANDLNKTITRTIKVTTPDGKATTTKQTVKLTRNADVDEVTGEVTYGNWTTGEWTAYDAPSVAGYTPSQTAVAKESVTATSKDTTVEISYLPVQHQISVEYVDNDDHGKIVKTDQVPGKTDQTITVTPSAPTNYDLVDNSNRTYTVTNGDGQAVQIHVKHHQVTTSESKTVTRTVNVHTPHDGVKTVKQTVELNRDVKTDQVTGDKAYGDWTTGQWKAYTPEAIPGYTSSANELPNVNIDGNSKNQMVDVMYTVDAQKVDIVYVDDTKGGTVVKTDQIDGKTDETVKVTPDVPAGYELVGKVPGDYTMMADGHQTITVHLVHQMKTASESKMVTRTINVHTPHDGTKVVKQTAKLTRDVTTDQVTGEKIYGDWSITAWNRYAVPAVAGYVPSIEQVAQQVVNGTTTDQTIDVTYSSGEHTTHINYVDSDGNIVHTTTIKGETDGTVQVPDETPAGWMVVGEPVPTELAFGPDGHTDVTVTVDHQHVTVPPDQSKTPADKLPDNPAKTYPNGVGHDDLNKAITRTIKVITPDGQTKTVTQTAKLTRTADVDEVTGKVAYGKWATGEWPSYEVPAVPGYTTSRNEVPAVKVTDDTKDQTVAVTYTANDQTTHINYVDGNGNDVHANHLPQTGNKSDSKLELLGLIGIAFAGLFGFGTSRKKRD